MYRLNRYSWILTALYLVLVCIMEYSSYKFSMEIIYLTAPIIGAFIFWSEETTILIQKSDSTLTKREAFARDLFLISFGFISGYFLYLMFEYNNSDVRGWWPLAIYFIAVQGLTFAFVFSLSATTLGEHKKYTLFFVGVLMLFLSSMDFLSPLYPLSIFNQSTAYYVGLLILIGLHLLFCLSRLIINSI